MDSARPAPASNLGGLWRTLTKIRRIRSSPAGSGVGGGVAPDDDVGINKLRFSTNLDGYSAVLSDPPGDDDRRKGEDDQKRHQQNSANREAMESLLANLFAGVSAVKAAYAQLQVAQSPYDPATIQSADQAVVSELQRLSQLKQSYIRGQLPAAPPDPQPALAAHIEEQHNLLKTYQITTRKLEADLQLRDADARSLRAQLLESETQNRSHESHLHPGRSLSAVDDLHLSGLNPTHFLAVLRYTVKSVRSFVKLMVKGMESAAWDLDAAAGSIHPGALRPKPGHRAFAFESYVCQMMFSDFQHRDFSLGSLGDLSAWDRRRFFEEFADVKALKPDRFLEGTSSPLGKFCRVKYLMLVHPKMEAAFFGDLEQRELVGSGRGFPDSEFFVGFAEMARRVWLAHCLFFSFGAGEEGSIFQARRGCRFSEVFMESVATQFAEGEAEVAAVGKRPRVGFTVVPGFRVGRTVIQCKVYLSSPGVKMADGRDGL